MGAHFIVKIIIAPDKFKGCLGAAEAAAAIARRIRSSWPDAIVELRPIADGGEGFVQALSPKWATQVNAHDALGRPILAEYGWLDASCAAIEMSAASGLWRIGPAERAPLRSSTFGTGELIFDAIARGAERILVGIGGSATNDGGVGMACALGYQLLDNKGLPVEPLPANLIRVTSICPPAARDFPRIIASCDVDNPLLGPSGATRTYGAQKGASPAELETLERALEHLANLVSRDLGMDFRDAPGAGAAGGLGFGLMSFLRAETRSGFDLVAEVTGLEEAIAGSDLVITGEGKMDAQTLRGKGPAGVAALARGHGKRVIAFAGICESAAALEKVFDAVYSIKRPEMSMEESIRDAARFLEQAAGAMPSL